MNLQVLLLGRKGFVIEDVEAGIDVPGIQLHLGTRLEDVQRIMGEQDIDHVIMGAGIDLDTRLQIVKVVFELSDTTCVHMKDRGTGPAGMMPFVNGILRGSRDQAEASL